MGYVHDLGKIKRKPFRLVSTRHAKPTLTQPFVLNSRLLDSQPKTSKMKMILKLGLIGSLVEKPFLVRVETTLALARCFGSEVCSVVLKPSSFRARKCED